MTVFGPATDLGLLTSRYEQSVIQQSWTNEETAKSLKRLEDSLDELKTELKDLKVTCVFKGAGSEQSAQMESGAGLVDGGK